MSHVLSYKNAPEPCQAAPGSLYDLAVIEARRDGAAELAYPRYFEPAMSANERPEGVLLIHGYCAGPLQGVELAKVLYANGYAVYMPRLKGHGTSPEDLRTRKWAEWHRDVELAYQFIRSRCSRVHVLGLSLGGTLGYLLASEYPEIASIVTNGAIFKVAHWGARPLRMVEAVLEHVFNTDLGVVHRSFSMPKVRIPQKELHYSYDIYPLRTTYQLMELADHVRSRLSLVRCPALIIQSQKDTVVHRDSATIIRDSISSADKEILWHGEEHISIVQPTAEITRKISAFIAG